DIVVHRAELLADLALDIASKAASGLALVDFCLHRSGPGWLVVFVHRYYPRPQVVAVVAPPTQWGITPCRTECSSPEGTFFGFWRWPVRNPCTGTWTGGFLA